MRCRNCAALLQHAMRTPNANAAALRIRIQNGKANEKPRKLQGREQIANNLIAPAFAEARRCKDAPKNFAVRKTEPTSVETAARPRRHTHARKQTSNQTRMAESKQLNKQINRQPTKNNTRSQNSRAMECAMKTRARLHATLGKAFYQTNVAHQHERRNFY